MLRALLPELGGSGDPVILEWKLVVLPQRITHPVVGAQNASQIRMPIEHDAEHVENLALVPVGRRPDVSNACDVPAVARHADLEGNLVFGLPESAPLAGPHGD